MNLIKHIRGVEIGRDNKKFLTVEVFFPISQELLMFVDKMSDKYYTHHDKINERKIFTFSIEIPKEHINLVNEIVQNQCYAILESTNDSVFIQKICELFVKHLNLGSAEFS